MFIWKSFIYFWNNLPFFPYQWISLFLPLSFLSRFFIFFVFCYIISPPIIKHFLSNWKSGDFLCHFSNIFYCVLMVDFREWSYSIIVCLCLSVLQSLISFKMLSFSLTHTDNVTFSCFGNISVFMDKFESFLRFSHLEFDSRSENDRHRLGF